MLHVVYNHALSNLKLVQLLIIMLFLFEGVSSSSGCLGKVSLFYCGTLWTFHLTFALHIQLTVQNTPFNHDSSLNRGQTGAVVSVANQGVPGSRPGWVAVHCGIEQVTFTPCLVLVKPRKPWTYDRLGQTVTRLETTLCLMC